MRITAYTCNTFEPEIKLLQLEHPIFSLVKACGCEKRYDKASKTAVDMHSDLVGLGYGGESGNGVLIAVGKVDTGSYKLCTRLNQCLDQRR